MTREEFKPVVQLVFRQYRLRTDIVRSFISFELADWVADHLMLERLSNQELSEMWFAVTEYFGDEFDEHRAESEYGSFLLDTKSAWSEVVNREARRRKAEGRMPKEGI